MASQLHHGLVLGDFAPSTYLLGGTAALHGLTVGSTRSNRERGY